MTTQNLEEPLLKLEDFYDQPSGDESPASYSEFADENPERKSKCSIFRKIPFIAYIVGAMMLVILILFLAASLLPPSEDVPPEYNFTNHSKSVMQVAEDENFGPKGIHISLTESPSAIAIQFSTATIGKAVVEIAEKSNPAETKKYDGESTTYQASDMCISNQSTHTKEFVPPGQLHTVKVTGLKVNVEYIYRAGISTGQGIRWGNYTGFRSPKPPGFIPKVGNNSKSAPLTFLALADQGIENGTITGCPFKPGSGAGRNVTRLITALTLNQTIDSIHIVGDLSYADGNTHIWDQYVNMIQPFASRVPTMVAVGNHEFDYAKGDGSKIDGSGMKTDKVFHPAWGGQSFHDEGGECGVPFAKRFAAPNNGNSVFWYSFEQSLMHTIILSSEHNMTKGSAQYKFLEADLAGVNRTRTPWIVVELHRPLYNSEMYWSSDAIGIAMRDEIEQLLHVNQVDLVMSGHYHAYLRTCDGLYQEKCWNGGPQYITIGTGGAPLDCNTPLIPNHYTKKFDDKHFGVGRVSVYNASALHFEFVVLGGEVKDDFWLLRER